MAVAKLVIGCGYLGRRVASLWRAEGAEVHALTRTVRGRDILIKEGIRGTVGDVLSPKTLTSLPSVDTVLFAVGYDRGSGVSIGEVYVNGLRNVLAALPGAPARFIYVSSTGVYGQSDGGRVDERSVCEPTRDGGRACLEAERVLQQHPAHRTSIVLRMAGIYGPGRVPRRHRLEACLPIGAPSDGYLNLIHVDDAARIVLAAERSERVPELYCVSDGCPVVRGDYYRELARLIGAPPPQFQPPPPGEPATARATSNKQVSNAKMLRHLRVDLQYPSYREGLGAIVEGETDG